MLYKFQCRRSGWWIVAVLVALLPAAAAAATSRAELDERARRAGEVFRELREAPDRRIPAGLLARSRCVAVVPSVIKAAWVFGGRYGRGVLSCRSKAGDWSPPIHVMLTGGSVGFQFGASSTDVVLFFMTTNSMRSLLTNRVKLSGEASVAAGPVGRETEAATDAKLKAEIYSYAKSRGLFAGVSLAGSYLGVSHEDTDAYYGARYTTSGILFDHKVTSVPKSAWSFLNMLPQPRATTSPKAPAAGKSSAGKAPRAGAPSAEPPAAALPSASALASGPPAAEILTPPAVSEPPAGPPAP